MGFLFGFGWFDRRGLLCDSSAGLTFALGFVSHGSHFRDFLRLKETVSVLTGEIPTLFKISPPRLVCFLVEFAFMDFREGVTHFNKSRLPSFDDLLQGLERKLRYCRRSPLWNL